MEMIWVMLGVAMGVGMFITIQWVRDMSDYKRALEDRIDFLAKEISTQYDTVLGARQEMLATRKGLEDRLDGLSRTMDHLHAGISQHEDILKTSRLVVPRVDNMERAIGELDLRQTVMKATLDTFKDRFNADELEIEDTQNQVKSISTLVTAMSDNVLAMDKSVTDTLADIYHEVDLIKARVTHRKRPVKPNPTDGTENIVREPADIDQIIATEIAEIDRTINANGDNELPF